MTAPRKTRTNTEKQDITHTTTENTHTHAKTEKHKQKQQQENANKNNYRKRNKTTILLSVFLKQKRKTQLFVKLVLLQTRNNAMLLRVFFCFLSCRVFCVLLFVISLFLFVYGLCWSHVFSFPPPESTGKTQNGETRKLNKTQQNTTQEHVNNHKKRIALSRSSHQNKKCMYFRFCFRDTESTLVFFFFVPDFSRWCFPLLFITV